VDINDPIDLYRKLPDKDNENAATIKKLKIFGSYVDHFYPQMFTLFPKLEEVQASGIYLIRLDQDDIGRTDTFKVLNVSYNKLHRLSKNMCDKVRELQVLDLSHNQIDRVLPDALRANTRLTYLDLSYNQIASLDRKFFDDIRGVATVKLNDNRISEITGDFKTFLSANREFHLQNNQIKTIDAQLLKNPSYIDLSFNKIGELNLQSARTIELKIVKNELRNLTIGRKLQKLDASENRYYQFKINSEKSSNNLTELYLSYIKMSLIDEKLFIDFRNFDKLKVLDLSDNNLITFNIRDISNGVLKSLEVLNLRNSHLSKLYNWEQVKFLLPSLKELNLYDNIFNCDEMKTMVSTFLTLNVSIPEYSEDSDGLFFSRSCVKFMPNYITTQKPITQIDHSVLIWCVISIFSLGMTITAIVFINKKLNVFEKLYDAIKFNPYKGRGTKLIDEEKAHDLENAY
jgi:Leucine-rich repeat (LRR) protein